MSEHIIAFYKLVEELGYSDCDDTVFCDCGASWYMHDYNPIHTLAVANGLRLHRGICDQKRDGAKHTIAKEGNSNA
jgi:hypothetical protein